MPPTADVPSGADPEPRLYPGTLFGAIAAAVVMHLNYWMWDVDSLVMGLPVNLFYHVVLTLVLAGFMSALVGRYWPPFLDDEGVE